MAIIWTFSASCVVILVIWLALNAASRFIAVKLELLEPQAANNSGGLSYLHIFIGPGSLRARHILLTKKTLKIASSYLIGLLPADVTEVRVDQYRLKLSWGLTRFVRAVVTGGTREKVRCKLSVRLIGVHVTVKGNGLDAWRGQEEAVAACVEGMNHFNANRLTSLIDGTAPVEGASPSALYRFIDSIINGLDVEVKGFHVKLESEHHHDHNGSSSAPYGSTLGSGTRPQLPIPGALPAGEQPRSSSHGHSAEKGWVLGIQVGYCRLFKKGDPTKETLEITPRAVQVRAFDLYYNVDETCAQHRRSKTGRVPRTGAGAESGGTAALPGLSDSEDTDIDIPLLPKLSTAAKQNNSLLEVEEINGTLLFPDVMCVLLMPGRQPGGQGKLLGLNLEGMKGVVVQLEPVQVYGLLTDTLPMLAMMGPYMEWYAETELQWHKRAYARRGATPNDAKKLEEYADALGVPTRASGDDGGDGDGGGVDGGGHGGKKGNATKLKELDKGLSLSQIMLMRMRVRKWDVARPNCVMTTAMYLLDSMDPFHGDPIDQFIGDLRAGSDVPGGGSGGGSGSWEGPERFEAGWGEQKGGAAGEESGSSSSDDSDEESHCASLGSRGAALRSGALALETSSEEESNRLESLLYFAAQACALANAEQPILMEIDLKMSAQDVAILISHPLCEQRSGKRKEIPSRVVAGHGGDGNDDDDSEPPEINGIQHQLSSGSVTLSDGEGQLSTSEAIKRRDALHLPALAAVTTIENFGFGFNMFMGSVASSTEDVSFCASYGGEEKEEPPSLQSDGPQAQAAACPGTLGSSDSENDETSVQCYTFSSTILPNAKRMRLHAPARLGQGADLRVEDMGGIEVCDGVSSMSLELTLGGARVTDFGGLEYNCVLPTLIGGQAAVSADGSSVAIDGGEGLTTLKLALYGVGGLEVQFDCASVSVVALPGRIMAILDVVLACLMGSPSAREAAQLDALEEEVAEEEEEEATGGFGSEVLAPSSRWRALDNVRGTYLYFGRMHARVAFNVHGFALLLPQDERDAFTNVIMAQCSGMTMDVNSGRAVETLQMNIDSFSIAPCVQREASSKGAIAACRLLHEAGVTVSLRGPVPKQLEVMRAGFPLKDLGLFPIHERRIILPVNMRLSYETEVGLRMEDAPEAQTNTLVDDMIRHNGSIPSDVSDADVQAKEDVARAEASQLAAIALLGREESGESNKGDRSGQVPGAEPALPGLYVQTEIKLHVSSGLRVKVTDLDLAVLQGIATSLVAALSPTPTDDSTATSGGRGSASLTFALDKAQRRMVASLRQAFRLADINRDGELDRGEVEELLRHQLEQQSLEPAQREAEVSQFISLLDEDGTETLNIDEFTGTMMRLMVDGPGESTLERAREQALTKAFNDADIDNSGSLDISEIAKLIKEANPLRTQSEIDRQVDRVVAAADRDGDGEVDAKEFLALMKSMRIGNPHEGPVALQAQEFRSWRVVRPMLEGFKSLAGLLAARPPDYAPAGFWDIFERETHATKKGSEGQVTETVQSKMVKAFENYNFARDAWSLLVAPAWYTGIVRVGSLAVFDEKGGGGARTSPGPQYMPAPIRPGTFIYAQEEEGGNGPTAPGSLSGMHITHLPEELAPSFGSTDPLSSLLPDPNEAGYVTGVRLSADDARRRDTFWGAKAPLGVKMVVDRPCTLLVCFHDVTAVIGASSVKKGSSLSSRQSSKGASELELPPWVEEMGLKRTNTKIDTILPGEGPPAAQHHVYRVFSVDVLDAGPIELGPGLGGSLPYFVLFLGGGHPGGLSFRKQQQTAGRIVRRSSVERARQRFRSRFKPDAKGLVRRRSSNGSNSYITRSRSNKLAALREDSAESVGRTGSVHLSVPAAVDMNPSWNVHRQYCMGSMGGGLRSVEKTADVEASKMANTALQLATFSTIGSAAGGGGPNGIASLTKHPRIRLKVTLLCEHGVFLQLNSLERLENTAIDGNEDPTMELEFKLPRPGSGSDAARGDGPVAVSKTDCLGCGGEVAKGGLCDRCGRPPPVAIKEGGAKPEVDDCFEYCSAAVKSGLTAMLDFEHVASMDILGLEDSLSMKAEFGMEGRYFNPRVQGSEHFIEPWSMSINMRDPRGSAELRGEMIAKRHFVLNATTALLSITSDMMDTRDHAKSRYSTKSVYTELRDGAQDDSRVLVVENHLGLIVTVSLEDVPECGASDPPPKTQRSLHSLMRHTRRSTQVSPLPRADKAHSTRVRIAASTYEEARAAIATPMSGAAARGAQAGVNEAAGPPEIRISAGKLAIPNAKKAIPTATVTITVQGFLPVSGVPLDLLGRGTHAYRMVRMNERSPSDVSDSGRKSTEPWLFEGLVVKFVSRPAQDRSVLDVAMQLETNVTLKNDMPRPLRIALSRENQRQPRTVLPVDSEVCIPFPVLRDEALRLWRSPRTLVGGDALRRALDKDSKRGRTSGWIEQTSAGDRRGQGQEEETDEGEEVSVNITPSMFDRTRRVVERHSKSMLLNGVTVERTDLVPTPGLTLHGAGDMAPGLWRLYARAPYVVQNGLACDIVLSAFQPPKEEEAKTTPRLLGRKKCPSPSFVAKTRGTDAASAAESSALTGGGGGSGDGGDGNEQDTSEEEDESDDDDDSDDDSDDESDTDGEEEQGGGEHEAVSPTSRVLWVLKSGEEVKLEGMDMTRPLHLKVGFAGGRGSSFVSDWSEPYVIQAKCHTDRTAINKRASEDAVFKGGARGAGGARRPEFKFGSVWEHTPGNRHIHIYAKVWVVNKTGVSLAYRAPAPKKEDDQSAAVSIRRPTNACYRTDGDTMLFSRYVTGGETCTKKVGAGSGAEPALPLMFSCGTGLLETMPYGMAADAIDSPLYLSETRTSKTQEPLPCYAVDGAAAGGDADTQWWPIYHDCAKAKVRLPREVMPVGARRVHLLTSGIDARVEKTMMDTLNVGSSSRLVAFMPSRDCRVYIGMDNRLLGPKPGPPKWLGLQGFERCKHNGAPLDAHATPGCLAPNNFALYSRFCRGLSVVSLGLNVGKDGDTVEGKDGSAAAMYFVFVVRVSEEEAVEEVDVGPVVMHRTLAFRQHHRWRLKPHFQPGDPCYSDRDASHTVTTLPEELQGKKLMQIVTMQRDKRVQDSLLGSFQVLQTSRVLVCFDSRAKKPPQWLRKKNFKLIDMELTGAPEGCTYVVYARVYREGEEVRLGGNKASGAKRMYFCLIHAHGDQTGRISAPPPMCPEVPPASDISTLEESLYFSARGVVDTGGGGDGGADGGGGNQSDEGAVEMTDDNQLFRFWDGEANGKLVQAPLNLDRRGRGWCKPFRTDAVKTTGEVKSPSGLFGVAIDSLTGAFLKTRVVTLLPRFVIRNDLGREVGVLPTLEMPPKGGDGNQNSAERTNEERAELANIQRAARKMAQAVPGGASIIIYDFADLDDYDEDEGLLGNESGRSSRSLSASGSVSASGRNPFKRIRGRKEDRLPCVRLLSGRSSEETSASDDRSESADDMDADGAGNSGSDACGERFVALPSVAVLLESIGKESYVWLKGGRYQRDVLVRVSCRMLPNGATVHVVLSDETPFPPLRIENRSSTQTLGYRLGGDSDDVFQLLEPMRWTALHWIDEERHVEAVLVAANLTGAKPKTARAKARKIREAVRRGRDSFKATAPHSDSSCERDDSSQGEKSGEEEAGSLDPEGGRAIGRTFESSGFVSKKHPGLGPLREYKTEDIGRLKDLVGDGERGQAEVHLKAECLRFASSVTTTLLAFSDSPDGTYGRVLPDWAVNSDHEGVEEALVKDDHAGQEEEAGEGLGMFARLWEGMHFEACFEGLVLNIIDSTVSGPSELVAFTVDRVEIGKPSGSPRLLFTVWHYQLDDMRPDSAHPTILYPKDSGFNSHLAKTNKHGPSAAPALMIEVEHDSSVSLLHNMSVIPAIVVVLGKVQCNVHVDFWVHVQDVVYSSLNWTSMSTEETRAMAVEGARQVVGQLLPVPASDARVDRIYIGSYHQTALEFSVVFHLGTKVMAMLSSKPAVDGDEEKDEGGFGASIAMMPLGAAGGVCWGLLSSFGAGVANASPTFSFDAYILEQFYGTATQAIEIVVMSLLKQGVVQAYKVLGHIDILGDPLSLGKSISSGVIGFVTKAGTGDVAGGTKDLVKGVVGGTASSASKIVGSLDHAVRSAGSLDSKPSADTGPPEMAKAPEHVGQGMTQALLYMGDTIQDGVTGFFMKPARGAKKSGVAGFIKGVGQGVVGLIAAPVSGALGATGRIASGIAATTHLLDRHPMGRRREPRHPLGAGERDDRDRLQKQLKQAKKKNANKRVDELDPIVVYGDSESGGESGGIDEGEEKIDTQAEAGGMGLFLLPLTPQDMRANYPEEIGGTASAVGAVARAKVLETAVAASENDSDGRHEEVVEEVMEEVEEQEEGEEEKEGETGDGGEKRDRGTLRGRVRAFRSRSRSPADLKSKIKGRVRWRSKTRDKSATRDSSS